MSVLILGQYATASLAVLALVGALFRFLVLLPLKAFIKEQTYLIQPYANSGKSLPDIALGIEAIKFRIDRLERRLEKIDTPKR
jgi:hypothetical protein